MDDESQSSGELPRSETALYAERKAARAQAEAAGWSIEHDAKTGRFHINAPDGERYHSTDTVTKAQRFLTNKALDGKLPGMQEPEPEPETGCRPVVSSRSQKEAFEALKARSHEAYRAYESLEARRVQGEKELQAAIAAEDPARIVAASTKVRDLTVDFIKFYEDRNRDIKALHDELERHGGASGLRQKFFEFLIDQGTEAGDRELPRMREALAELDRSLPTPAPQKETVITIRTPQAEVEKVRESAEEVLQRISKLPPVREPLPPPPLGQIGKRVLDLDEMEEPDAEPEPESEQLRRRGRTLDY